MTGLGYVLMIIVLIIMSLLATIISSDTTGQAIGIFVFFAFLSFMVVSLASIQTKLESPTRIAPQVIVVITEGVADTTFIYRRKP